MAQRRRRQHGIHSRDRRTRTPRFAAEPAPSIRFVEPKGQKTLGEALRQVLPEPAIKLLFALGIHQRSDTLAYLPYADHGEMQTGFIRILHPGEQARVRHGFDQFGQHAGIKQKLHSTTSRPALRSRTVSMPAAASGEFLRKSTKEPWRRVSLS